MLIGRSSGPAILVLVATILAGPGCSRSPEQRIRDRIEEARVAAEDGDLPALRTMVSEDYGDDHGHDRDEILATVAYYVRVEGGLHVWTRVQEVRILEPRRAQARILVALAAGPVKEPQDLLRLGAELHRFTVELVKEKPGGWKLRYADWSPVRLDEFV